jgi:hypothetical protein
MTGILGILLALALLIYLAYRGVSVLVLAPVLALLAVVLDGTPPLLASYTQVFMREAGDFIVLYFPLFLLGAIFGKLMDDSGFARAIAECGRVPAEFRPWCYSGIAKHFVDLTADPADALAFCARIPEEAGRRQCFQATGEQIALLTYDPGERAALCAVTGDSERRACILGADLPDPEGAGPQ